MTLGALGACSVEGVRIARVVIGRPRKAISVAFDAHRQPTCSQSFRVRSPRRDLVVFTNEVVLVHDPGVPYMGSVDHWIVVYPHSRETGTFGPPAVVLVHLLEMYYER